MKLNTDKIIEKAKKASLHFSKAQVHLTKFRAILGKKQFFLAKLPVNFHKTNQ
jgi:hypothetical protein